MQFVLSPEALRAQAIGQVQKYGDLCAQSIVAHGLIHLKPSDDTWESSAGLVHPYTVYVGVTANEVAHLQGHPATNDILCAVFSSVISSLSSAKLSLKDLHFYFGLSKSLGTSVYRSTEQFQPIEYNGQSIGEGLIEYFHTVSLPNVAQILTTATLDVQETTKSWTIRIHCPQSNSLLIYKSLLLDGLTHLLEHSKQQQRKVHVTVST